MHSKTGRAGKLAIAYWFESHLFVSGELVFLLQQSQLACVQMIGAAIVTKSESLNIAFEPEIDSKA